MAADECNRPADAGYFLDVPEPVRRRIERERRRLQRASAVLRCLVYAANHDAPDIDCGDVARVALDLIVGAVDALDVVRLSADKGRANNQKL